MKRRILCYGDSNTWGVIPHGNASEYQFERYDTDTRWPCVTAHDLGTDWTLIEEGLGGRTTIYRPPGEDYRRGDHYLYPCLLSHRPLDYVVIMLGVNDIQPKMHTDGFPESEWGKGIEKLIDIVRELPETGAENRPARILLISPPPIRMSESRPDISEKYGNEKGAALSEKFPEVYKAVAEKYNCGFLDASLYACAGEDGIHFTKESHLKLGHEVADYIRKMDQNKTDTRSYEIRKDIDM